MAGVNQADFESSVLEDRIGGDPVVASTFECDGANPATQKPVTQGMDAIGETGKRPHGGLRIAPQRHGGEDFAGSDVDAGGVRVGLRIEASDILLRLDWCLRVCFLRWFMSALGCCFKCA